MTSDPLTDLLEFVAQHARHGDPESVIETVDRFASGSRDLLIHIGEEKGRLLDEVIRDVSPRRVLELGSFFGYAAVRMGRLMNLGNSSLITLEIDDNHASIARELVAFAGLGDRITVISGDAGEILPTLVEPFDVILLDHLSHRYLDHLRLIEKRQLLRSGTVVVADNVIIHQRELGSYLDHVRHGGRYRSVLRSTNCRHLGNITDGFEVSTWLGT